jgi:hypothetical protein
MSAVTRIGTPRAAGFLLSVAGSTDDPDRLKGAAASLTIMHVREAIPILLARLDTGEGRVRAQLVMSLAYLKARDHTPELVRTTLGMKPEDFYYAIHGFSFLGDPSVVPALRRPLMRCRRRTCAGSDGQVNEIAVGPTSKPEWNRKRWGPAVGGVVPPSGDRRR